MTDDTKKAVKLNRHPVLPVAIIAAFLVLFCGTQLCLQSDKRSWLQH